MKLLVFDFDVFLFWVLFAACNKKLKLIFVMSKLIESELI